MKPLFTLIIPVYNAEKYLPEALKSVIQQNFDSLEIILVNDQSTDTSPALCDQYASDFSFIRVIHQQVNAGVSHSRNTGIDAAAGDYILFLDSDDKLEKGCLEGLAQTIQEKPEVDLIISKFMTQRYAQRKEASESSDFDFDNSKITESSSPVDHIADFTRLSPACWRYGIRRNFLNEIDLRFIKAKVYEDLDFVCRLLCQTKKYTFYQGTQSWYRASEGGLGHSSVHQKDLRFGLSYLQVAESLSSFYQQKKLSFHEEEFLQVRIKASLRALYCYLPLYTDIEIESFKSTFPKKPNFLNFEDKLYQSVKEKGLSSALIEKRSRIIKKILGPIESKEGQPFFVFCADLFGMSTANILLANDFQVQSFLDNNTSVAGSLLMSKKVQIPSDIPKNERDKSQVIICQQRPEVFQQIHRQLTDMGLKKENLYHALF